jgi:methylmalonyl-CoA mutase
MPDTPQGRNALKLREEFPPVPTETWEQTIVADLKGADYEKKLVWKTDEGIAVRPYYRKENLPEKPFRHCVAGSWEIADPAAPVDAIDAVVFHEAGANAIQELAYAMASASECLAGGGQVTAFQFAVGSNYFFEIAKLRAARQLWAAVAGAYGVPSEVKIHAITALSNKSIYDPYTNLLRCTTEALSAVLGGVDSLAVQAAGYPERLGRNVQLVLKEEAHLDKVADPAGGSYYIEALTDALAREAWKLFQQVEAEGGFNKAQASIDAAIATARAAKEKAVSSRRRTLVGVNNYPDINEKELDQAGALPAEVWRLARPIEEIRLRTERHARKSGQTPKVLLLKRGDVKMKMARAQFCQNFFGCAGFAIEESESYQGTDAAMIVLCSSDPEYVDFAKEVCGAVQVPVVVAGNPKEQIGELKAAGVGGFIHVLSNLVDTLSEWQDKLGMDGVTGTAGKESR